MILLVHMIVGAAIGYRVFTLTQNIWLSCFVALISHYALDAIPHIEYTTAVEDLGKRIKSGKAKDYLSDVVKIALDFLLGIIVLFLISNQPTVYLYAFLGIFPDALTVVNSLVDNALLKKHQQVHGEKLQQSTRNKKFPVLVGILTQVAAVVVAILFLC